MHPLRFTKKYFPAIFLSALSFAMIAFGGLPIAMNSATHSIEKKITHIANLNLPKATSGLPTSFLAVFKQKGPYLPMNILVLGSDTRRGQGVGFGNVAGARSDTVMLFHVNASRTQATEISFPRDLWITLPPCGQKYGYTQDKFNSAFAYGGAGCTMDLVSAITGLSIDHVVITDFKGFESVVNAMGGLNVCLSQPVNDIKAHVNLPAGQQLLNGTQALGLARARYSLADGSDLQRIKRQQALVKLAVSQIKDSGVITNPMKLYALGKAVASSLSVDPSLTTLPALAGLAWQMKDIKISQIQTMTVPYVKDSFGHYIVDGATADPIFMALKSDSPLPGASNPEPNSSASPGSSSTSVPVPATPTPTAPVSSKSCVHPLF